MPLLEALGAIPDIHVRDTEPYSGKHPHDFTIDYHAEEAGLPHVSIEIRQDLIASGDGAARWAAILQGRAHSDPVRSRSLHQLDGLTKGLAMQPREPAWTIGIEEEYLLVDKQTMELVNDPPPSIMEECKRLTTRVSPELLRSQIEVGTGVCRTVAEARADLIRLRGVVIEAAGREGRVRSPRPRTRSVTGPNSTIPNSSATAT